MIFKNESIRSRGELLNKYLLFFLLVCVFSEREAKVNSTKKNALIRHNDGKKLNFSSESSHLPTISSIQHGSAIQNGTTLDGVAKFHIPYHVSLQAIKREKRRKRGEKKEKTRTYEHLCAGTIIDEYYVLTAAHCFYKVKNPKHWRVVAGSNKLFNGTSYNVTKIIIHDYFQPLMGRDIALLRIAPKFKFDGKTIEKINFYVTNKTESNLNAYLIGWGPTKKKVDKRLELISFRTINMDKCRKRGFIYVSSTELCAISYKGRGACDGDSGGPLVNTKFNLQLGILSYGRKPCMRGRIYAFTKLRPLVGWILKHIKKKKDQIHKTGNTATAASHTDAAQARRVLKLKPH